MPDVHHALTTIRSGDPVDAAVLNVWLRGELSFPVADGLRQRGIPFIVVTGNAADATQRYPGVRSHPEPADMDVVVRNLSEADHGA